MALKIVTLIEDPSNVTVQSIAREAWQHLSRSAKTQQGSESAVASSTSGQAASSGSWIARAPIQIKMRLFCLPYAGGVSENVFGR